MDATEYRLAAYAASVPNIPAFVMPLFICEGNWFRQCIDEANTVKEFEPVDPQYVIGFSAHNIKVLGSTVGGALHRGWIDLKSAVTPAMPLLKVGDEAIFGFQSSPTSMFFGRRGVVAKRLMASYREYVERPFLYAKIYDFATQGVFRETSTHRLAQTSFERDFFGRLTGHSYYVPPFHFIEERADQKSGIFIIGVGIEGEAILAALNAALPQYRRVKVVFLSELDAPGRSHREVFEQWLRVIEHSKKVLPGNRAYSCISESTLNALGILPHPNNLFQDIARRVSPEYSAWEKMGNARGPWNEDGWEYVGEGGDADFGPQSESGEVSGTATVVVAPNIFDTLDALTQDEQAQERSEEPSKYHNDEQSSD